MEVRVCCKACGEALEGEETLVCPSCHRAWAALHVGRWAQVPA